MKKFLVLSVLLLPLALAAQVREFNIGATDNSIVRTVDDTTLLIYTQPSAGDGYFLLYKTGAASALAFRLPVGWEVRDVRIYNGVDAYFCGTDGTRGLVGMFDIASAFSGTGAVNYTPCSGFLPVGFHPTDLKRLELYEYGVNVCMAMAGDSEWDGIGNNTTVVSAYIDAVGNWRLAYYANKNHLMDFTDVACLDDVVVAVGTDIYGNGCYVKTFQKNERFPCWAYDQDHKLGINFGVQKGEVLATHREGNTVVLAQYCEGKVGYATALYEMELSPLTGLPVSPTIGTWLSLPPAYQPYGPSWRMLELDWYADSVWLLQKAEYAMAAVSGVADWVMRVPLAALSGTAHAWHPHQCNAQSMDIDVGKNKPWLSGEMPHLALYEPVWLARPGNCYRYSDIDFEAKTALWQQSEIGDGCDFSGASPFVYNFSVFSVIVRLQCE